MKLIHFILLTLAVTLLLVACERPAPAGEIPVPPDSGNSTEIVPRADDPYPPAQTDETPGESAEPAEEPAPDTPADATTEEGTEAQPAENEEVAPVDDPEPEAAEGESLDVPALVDGVYTVRAGDTLGQIAFIFDVSIEDIMAANDLANADVLDVGQELTIPEAGFADAQETTDENTAATDEEPAADTVDEEQIHIVQPGDNLYRIGIRYGFTIDELAEYNELTDVNNLEVGQEIRIPPSD